MLRIYDFGYTLIESPLFALHIYCIIDKKIFLFRMSFNSFSSLENINEFFNSLIDSNENALPLKHISKLMNDLTNVMHESDYYDVEIKIGNGNNVKIFKAHSHILKARSLYFRSALSNNWVERSENGIILFEKENISPKIFEIILM